MEPNSPITAIRPFTEDDRPFFHQVVNRLIPAEHVHRDPIAFAAWFERLASGHLDQPEGCEAFVAVDGEDRPLGLLMIQPTTEYFTGAPRAYVAVLVVAAGVEGQGVARALMHHAEAWAISHGYTEIALDVFASNSRAITFYERNGYTPDLIRMVKTIQT